MASTVDSGKSYHHHCTGDALETANAHTTPQDLTLFAACYCPFVQRAWTAIEHLGLEYRYYEVDAYKVPKPAELLEVSPKGLVPALKLHKYDTPKALNESTVIIDFLEEMAASTNKGTSLFPPASDPYARALIRLQADTVSRTLIPAFYRYLQAQDEEKQIEGAKAYLEAISALVALFQRAESEGFTAFGLWNENGALSYADVMVAPWLFRSTNVLKHYRGFVLPDNGQFRAYIDRLINYPSFKRTCSTEQLYLDSYERYAFNRPNTSQMANAINAGTPLP